MTARKTALYGVGGALLVAYLAGANMPSGDPVPPRERQAAPASTPDALAVDVSAQAARLRARMAQAPVPEGNPRNPFSFGAQRLQRAAAPSVHAAVVEESPVAPMLPIPALTLMGIAEEAAAPGVRRTAIIGGDGDTIYMVMEGQPVGDRYKVTRIGADAVELEDLRTHAYRRIALR